MKQVSNALLIVFLLLFSSFSFAIDFGKNKNSEFLPVDQAFSVQQDVTHQGVNLVFDTFENYYLYKHRFSFNLVSASDEHIAKLNAQIPEGIEKDDPYFGLVQVYYGQLVIPVSIVLDEKSKALLEKGELLFEYHYQGCAEAGLCYPPQKKLFKLPQSLANQLASNTQSQASVEKSNLEVSKKKSLI